MPMNEVSVMKHSVSELALTEANFIPWYSYLAISVLKHEIPGQAKVIPGSLDTPSKLVKSLDCPGHPWTVGNYGLGVKFWDIFHLCCSENGKLHSASPHAIFAILTTTLDREI